MITCPLERACEDKAGSPFEGGIHIYKQGLPPSCREEPSTVIPTRSACCELKQNHILKREREREVARARTLRERTLGGQRTIE